MGVCLVEGEVWQHLSDPKQECVCSVWGLVVVAVIVGATCKMPRHLRARILPTRCGVDQVSNVCVHPWEELVCSCACCLGGAGERGEGGPCIHEMSQEFKRMGQGGGGEDKEGW